MQLFCFLISQSTSSGFEYRNESNEVIVNCSSDLNGEVVIPQNVKIIVDYAFKNCQNSITSISFEEDSKVISIGSYSFYNAKIETANLSNCNKLTLLNESVFGYCRFLTLILLPQNISSIGRDCFLWASSLQSIDLPDSVETIYRAAFSYSGLTTIKISKTSKLSKLDSVCFTNTKLSSFFILKYLKDLTFDSFDGCQYLENITLDPENQYYKFESKTLFSGADNSTLFRVINTYSESVYVVPPYVINISKNCFYKLKIKSILLHNKITYIGKYAFYECKSLTSITLPENVISIKDYTFQYCTSLTSVTLPKNLQNIDAAVFDGCTSLRSIVFPESLKIIEIWAFYQCTSLNNITFLNNSNSIIFGLNPFLDILNPVNIYVPGMLKIIEGVPEVFPKGSHLYITNQTILLSCVKYIFGEKFFHVHFDEPLKISDKSTIDTIIYISIEDLSFLQIKPKTIDDFIYDHSISAFLSSFIISIIPQS